MLYLCLFYGWFSDLTEISEISEANFRHHYRLNRPRNCIYKIYSILLLFSGHLQEMAHLKNTNGSGGAALVSGTVFTMNNYA